MRICFFARVESPRVLETVEFYRQDIELLRSLGHEVFPAVRGRQIRTDVDLYYVWWWTWAFQPLLPAKLFGKPLVITGVLDYPYPVPGRGYEGRPLWQRLVMSAALRSADRNVFLSRHEMEGVSRDLPVREPRCIPLAVDTEAYCPGVSPREDFVFSVIWMEKYNVWRKCAVEIVEAIPRVLAAHPEARFVIAGGHDTGFEEVLAAARRLGVERVVSFPGVIGREEKVDLMRRCRLYLQPTRYEGFGAAILEAMSCGAPVATNAVGAVPEVAGDAAHFLSGPDASAVAEGVNALWSNAERREDFGSRARARAVEVFSLAGRRTALQALLAELGLRRHGID
jgi:glycosyltransferase involved in cell wall biosynthesis